MATRAEVVAEARTWLGTRFHHQARIKGHGVDCINLVIGVGTSLGLGGGDFDWNDHPEYHGYGKSPDGYMLLAGCDRFLDRIPFDEVKPADILIFRFVEEPQHFAIVTQVNPMYMIHAYAQVRRVAEHGFDAVWKSRLVQCYRFRNLSDEL